MEGKFLMVVNGGLLLVVVCWFGVGGLFGGFCWFGVGGLFWKTN